LWCFQEVPSISLFSMISTALEAVQSKLSPEAVLLCVQSFPLPPSTHTQMQMQGSSQNVTKARLSHRIRRGGHEGITPAASTNPCRTGISRPPSQSVTIGIEPYSTTVFALTQSNRAWVDPHPLARLPASRVPCRCTCRVPDPVSRAFSASNQHSICTMAFYSPRGA
jgi:hypothetical protein